MRLTCHAAERPAQPEMTQSCRSKATGQTSQKGGCRSFVATAANGEVAPKADLERRPAQISKRLSYYPLKVREYAMPPKPSS
jgi:hypothetical protein